ncbi:multidrug effflux MFS transporter [Bartonella krasnovii]|uniref:Bcr/CflA family efflux transporter n=1 Tax=Bartonella krasnovii TaxID=2267275 RepID=A0A5B9D259_9HYPH|nr:multidrug effflux MFS transporter [Bartonella krasnovii]QEE12643.1 multidrug effflux MFS transporter [Bartonella krasnovii]UNF28648.1 multidrug effflux MFS transporter [Bartonella krasnovii]UNF35024.1 multidrug effflux MFS transporter [Bartonella krasnovii]UNF36660.1 multidrug effflux MFS transporter [Bartonella krasnovii]UNF38432.1 multidrug effflux MFS transporter [Bartonella krasnovii]
MNRKYTLSFIIFIVCLSTGGLISTDIFLPALGDMRQYYQVTQSQIQSAVAVFLFALALGQLIYGPLSDNFGRKKTLLLGLFLWLFTTIGVIYTVHIHAFLVLRFLQGLGACAGLVLSRAIINDLLDKKAAGKLYLIVFPFIGMSPALAPFIGGLLIQAFHWQATFIFLSVFIFLTILLCCFVLTETLPLQKRQPFSPIGFMKGYLGVLRNKQFIFYALIPCFSYAAYFAYIVESPFLLTTLGLSPIYISYSYIGVSLPYILGNFLARWFFERESMEKTVGRGYVIFVIGGVLFALQMYLSPWPLVTSFMAIAVLTFGNGFLLPLGTALAISSHPQAAGAASGVMGSLQLGSAALSAALIGKISGHSPRAMATLLAVCCMIGFIIYIQKARHFMTSEIS